MLAFLFLKHRLCLGQFKVCHFSPNRNLQLLSAGDAEGFVYIYDYAKRTLKHKLRGHQGQVTALTFTPDALWLMAGSSGMGTGDLWVSVSVVLAFHY